MAPILTIQDFTKQFPNNDACLEDLFKRLYPNPKCPKCKRVGKYHRRKKTSHYVCNCGRHSISPKKGTIFHKSELDLVKWYYALFLMSQSKNGVAALELQRHVGVKHYQTALRMMRMIRSIMDDNEGLLFGEVEVDETVVGGKRRGKRGRGAEGKTIVFGAVQRKGKMKAVVVKDVKAATLLPHFTSNIAKGTKVLIDELTSYKKITRVLGMEHDSVTHGKGQYVKGNTHTNTIEGFWSQMKRSIDGTHHVVSPRWLPSYVREYQWKWNHRDASEHAFYLLLKQACAPQGQAA